MAHILFWNVHGYSNANDISEQLEVRSILCISETWLEKQITFPMLTRLVFNSIQIPAIRTHTHGRAKGGLIVLFNDKLFDAKILFSATNFVIIRFTYIDSNFLLCFAYLNPNEDLKADLALLDREITEACFLFPDDPVFLGGDLNCRVAEFNSFDRDIPVPESVFTHERKSLDKELNYRGQLLLEFLEENGFLILNGRSIDDSPANFTCLSDRGCTVIVLVCCPLRDIELVKHFSILDIPSTSDHLPIKLTLNFDKQNQRDSQPPESQRPPLKWNQGLAENYHLLMRFSPNIAHVSNDIDEMNENFLNTIYDTMEKIIYYYFIY